MNARIGCSSVSIKRNPLEKQICLNTPPHTVTSDSPFSISKGYSASIESDTTRESLEKEE